VSQPRMLTAFSMTQPSAGNIFAAAGQFESQGLALSRDPWRSSPKIFD
jgi:hypothetical protein